MSYRLPQSEALTVKQRLGMFQGTGVTTETALMVEEKDITFDYLISNGVRALNLVTADLRPLSLKKYGVETASQLRRLGFDALHLSDAVFCSEANAAYGAEEVIGAFLTSPSDAVALAGSEAIHVLGITTVQLLEMCAGAPTEANAVLQATTGPSPLEGVCAKHLLDSGLRAAQLTALGFNFAKLMSDIGATPEDVQKLGFRL